MGLEGVRGIVADSKAYSRRTLGVCLEHKIGFVTLVPRTCAVRQELEAWGPAATRLAPLGGEAWADQGRSASPLAWTKCDPPGGGRVQRWTGRQEALRFVVVHSSQLAQQQTQTYASGQGKEAEAVADHVQRVQAQWFACLPDAEAAIAAYEGQGAGTAGAAHAPGAITRSAIASWQTPAARAGPVGAGQRRRTHRRSSRAIAWWWRSRPGQSGRGQWVDGAGHDGERGDLYRCGDSPGLSGATHHRGTWLSLDQESRGDQPPCGWRSPNGLRPWRCSRWWACWSTASSSDRSVCTCARMTSRLPGNKGATATPTAAVVLALFAQVAWSNYG